MKKLVLTVIFFSLLQTKAFAQTQNQNINQTIRNIFSVSPIIVDTQIHAGENLQIPMDITNHLSEPLGIKVTVENFYPSDGETVIDNFKNSPLVDWSSVSKDNFILDSKQNQSITLSIKTPQNLKDGGYYAVVFFTPFYDQPNNSSSPTVLSKVGSLILATAGKINYQNLKEKVAVNQMNFGLFDQSGKEINYSFLVDNSYFTHFSAKPFLTISPLFGKAQTIQLEDKRVLPGTQRAWIETLSNKNLGIFNSVNLAVSVGEGNYVYKSGFFFVFPVKEISILILILLVLSIIKFRGKQIKKATKIIFQG